MALLKTTTSSFGFEAVNAYHRVEAVSLEGKDKINFHVRSYKEVGMPFFAEQVLSCAYDIAGENPIKQAYSYLKTLPQFAGALDC
jgi:hypothetical protein